eukprot:762972-Hanusia_phi.AAC.2
MNGGNPRITDALQETCSLFSSIILEVEGVDETFVGHAAAVMRNVHDAAVNSSNINKQYQLERELHGAVQHVNQLDDHPTVIVIEPSCCWLDLEVCVFLGMDGTVDGDQQNDGQPSVIWEYENISPEEESLYEEIASIRDRLSVSVSNSAQDVELLRTRLLELQALLARRKFSRHVNSFEAARRSGRLWELTLAHASERCIDKSVKSTCSIRIPCGIYHGGKELAAGIHASLVGSQPFLPFQWRLRCRGTGREVTIDADGPFARSFVDKRRDARLQQAGVRMNSSRIRCLLRILGRSGAHAHACANSMLGIPQDDGAWAESVKV